MVCARAHHLVQRRRRRGRCRGRGRGRGRLSHSRAAVCVGRVTKVIIVITVPFRNFCCPRWIPTSIYPCSATTHTSAPPTYLPSWPDPILLPTFPRAQSCRRGPPLSGDFSPLRGEFIGQRTRRLPTIFPVDSSSSRGRRLFPRPNVPCFTISTIGLEQ